MKTYCSDCGYKVEYKTGGKPNFCPKCGFSFNKEANAKREQNSENQAETEESEESINLSDDFELEFDIMDPPKNKNKLSDLAGTSEGGVINVQQNAPKKGRGRPRKTNKKEVWEEFKKEAGGNPHREGNEQ